VTRFPTTSDNYLFQLGLTRTCNPLIARGMGPSTHPSCSSCKIWRLPSFCEKAGARRRTGRRPLPTSLGPEQTSISRFRSKNQHNHLQSCPMHYLYLSPENSTEIFANTSCQNNQATLVAVAANFRPRAVPGFGPPVHDAIPFRWDGAVSEANLNQAWLFRQPGTKACSN
jgi:hypothetical protein